MLICVGGELANGFQAGNPDVHEIQHMAVPILLHSFASMPQVNLCNNVGCSLLDFVTSHSRCPYMNVKLC